MLTATSSMAAGINTPASAVIITETTRAAPGNPPMSIGEVRNMAGRAGRFGYQGAGRAIMIAESSWQRRALVDRYVLGAPPALHSTFEAKDIPTWMIRLLRQLSRVPRNEVAALLLNSFGGYVASLCSPDFLGTVEAQVTALLARMQQEGLINEDPSGIGLTLLGKACGTASISLESCLLILGTVRRLNRQLTPEQLMALSQIVPESDTYIPMNRRNGSPEGRWIGEATRRFGNDVAACLQQNAAQASDVWARAKRALIVLAYVNGTPINRIESDFTSNARFYGVGAGDITGTADNSRFRLHSIFELSRIAHPAFAPPADAMDRFFLQLELGVPADSLDLVNAPVPLNRAACLSLRSAGITTVDALLQSPEAMLVRLISTAELDSIRPYLVLGQPQ